MAEKFIPTFCPFFNEVLISQPLFKNVTGKHIQDCHIGTRSVLKMICGKLCKVNFQGSMTISGIPLCAMDLILPL